MSQRKRTLQRQKSLRKLRQTHLILSQISQQIPDGPLSHNIDQSQIEFRQQCRKRLQKIKNLTKKLSDYHQNDKPKKPKKKRNQLPMTQSLIYEPSDNQERQEVPLQPAQQQLQVNLRPQTVPTDQLSSKVQQFLDSQVSIRKLFITFFVIFLLFSFSSLSPEFRLLIWHIIKSQVPEFIANPVNQYIKQQKNSRKQQHQSKDQSAQFEVHEKIIQHPQLVKKYCKKGQCKYGIIQFKSFDAKLAQEIIQNDL